ncbi:hypothetical protein PanWU01x14_091870 [Parasponia andersonii]|uniref:Uncharacterized protein n=1 Tax=Parasponia andersonii TaxID=3476 RepID=A0A2P5D6D7_PARAD|nr:hypothetical protein PanWU01x14_091870 [Parasponia andersonii]
MVTSKKPNYLSKAESEYSVKHWRSKIFFASGLDPATSHQSLRSAKTKRSAEEEEDDPLYCWKQAQGCVQDMILEGVKRIPTPDEMKRMKDLRSHEA